MSVATYRHQDIVANVGRILTNAVAVQNTMRGLYDFLNTQAHRSDYGGLFGIDDLIDLEKLHFPISADFDPFDLTDIAYLFGKSMNGYGTNFYFTFSHDYQKLYYDYTLEWKFRYVISIPGEIQGILHEIAVIAGGSFDQYETFSDTHVPKNNGLNTVKSVLASLPKNAAKGIGRMRQVLTQIQEDPRWDDYYAIEDELDAHMSECDQCAEEPGECDEYQALREPQDEIYAAIMADWFALNYKQGQEIASSMLDPYSYRNYYDTYPNSSSSFSNPLVFDRLSQYGASVFMPNGQTRNVYAVRLVRKYAMVQTGQNFDYNESGNGFSAGNPNLIKSNIFTWLNSTTRGKQYAWQVASHINDTFRSSSKVYWGYLECVEDDLLPFLVKTAERNKPIASYTAVSTGYEYAPAYVTILSARDYALSSTGKVNGWYMLDNETNVLAARGYYGVARKIPIASIGSGATDTTASVMAKSILNNTTTTSMRYLYYAAKLTSSSTGFTNCQPNTASMAVQPAHNIVPFHLDESIGADPQYLKPPTFTRAN